MSDRFVWHELMTTDTKGAIAFYTEVVGWKTEVFPDSVGPEPYTMWVTSQGPMGGVMTLPDDVKKMGVPPHWMGHVGVKNVDQTLERAKKLGGSAMMPPMDIPKVGRFCVIADPQGATLSLFQANEGQEMPASDTSKAGQVSWNELITSDAKAGLAFYSELFGWKKLNEHDMGPHGIYYIFGEGEKSFGGMMTKTPDMPMPPSWTYYIQTDDLDVTTARANSKGAKTLVGPMDVPGGTRVAQLVDPQGVHFALHGPGKK
jgi:predicted enzyme related to lactoylglutathione lyase